MFLHTYFFKWKQSSWQAALTACTSLGFEGLVNFESLEEWEAVRGLLEGPGQHFWIDGINTGSNNWIWTSGALRGQQLPDWAPWKPGHPVNALTHRVAVEYFNEFVANWTTIPDSERHNFVCKRVICILCKLLEKQEFIQITNEFHTFSFCRRYPTMSQSPVIRRTTWLLSSTPLRASRPQIMKLQRTLWQNWLLLIENMKITDWVSLYTRIQRVKFSTYWMEWVQEKWTRLLEQLRMKVETPTPQTELMLGATYCSEMLGTCQWWVFKKWYNFDKNDVIIIPRILISRIWLF